jgi:RNA polymerase sigma-70 factor, ECF subfamily
MSAAETRSTDAAHAWRQVARARFDAALAPLSDDNVDAFARHLARHLGSGDLDAASERRITSLFLAWAAASGHAPAARAFRDTCEGDLRQAVMRIVKNVPDTDEVAQRVLTLLVVGADGGEPTLLGYGGRGELSGFVRVAAARHALNFVMRSGKELASDDRIFDSVLDGTDDPEARLVRERCKAELRDGFAAALASLDTRDRNLLRHAFLEEMSIDAIGTVYRVHRATAARWVSAARGRLLDAFRGTMKARLSVTETELESLVRWARSGVDLSIERCFGATG